MVLEQAKNVGLGQAERMKQIELHMEEQ